jgi:hypothetical protein
MYVLDKLTSKHIKKHQRIDIIVLKITNHALGNSRPCQLCISKMSQYNIRNVYYSNAEGGITKINFSKLLQEPSYVCKRYCKEK